MRKTHPSNKERVINAPLLPFFRPPAANADDILARVFHPASRLLFAARLIRLSRELARERINRG